MFKIYGTEWKDVDMPNSFRPARHFYIRTWTCGEQLLVLEIAVTSRGYLLLAANYRSERARAQMWRIGGPLFDSWRWKRRCLRGAVNSDAELQIRRINNSAAHAAALFCSCFTAPLSRFSFSRLIYARAFRCLCLSKLPSFALRKRQQEREDANKFWARLTSGRF